MEVGDTRLLLGADLEEHDRPHEGWTAILDSDARPRGKAQIFKVAHHGSPNGDTPRIWSELLFEKPVAAVTSFLAGPTPRPADSDVRRLCAKVNDVFFTGKKAAPKRRDPVIEKSMNETVKNRRIVEGATGQIRIRPDAKSSIMNVELSNGAYRACSSK